MVNEPATAIDDAEYVLADILARFQPNDGMAATFTVSAGDVAAWRYRFRSAAAELGVRLRWKVGDPGGDGMVRVWVKAIPIPGKFPLDDPTS